ncbi:MAG: acetoacetate--CoA ligase [Bacteroidales bacterium]|nr:acetoacetate--CoA ligase [Bacteroidales bacterium]
MGNSILWQPSEDFIFNSRMYDFLSHVAENYNLPENSYQAVYKWSIHNIDAFWAEVWDYCGIVASVPYEQVVDNELKMPGAKWFSGARLNFAENLLRKRDNSRALIFYGENSVRKEFTYSELYDEVRKLAAGLKRLGVVKGDRIAAFMPNMPETVIGMLAATSIGAIWSSTSPDFGTKGVYDRFSQIQPKIIFAADGYFYKGKSFDTQDKLKEILVGLPSIEHVILTDYTGHIDLKSVSNAMAWSDVVKETEDALEFEQLPFDHPLYIMYSSGTTGLPKSIVHSAGGTLIQHLKELILHSDIQSGQTVFYYTTCGWMMWNWFVSALATGATLVLYDGNPFYPRPDALLRMADELKLSFFGTSAKYIASLEAEGVIPKEISDFPKLKVIASTGSPLTDESFDYVYRDWKKNVQLSSIAGGTDIISCFMLGNPTLPVYKSEIQCRGLGMAVECYDDNGKSILNEQGELICRKAFPSMPIYFWNDKSGERYFNAYFKHFPGVWRHGDNISISDHGGVSIFGRSDATLNPQGVRIGTAEIYGVVESMEEIEDSVVIGKKEDGDEKVVLFVKLKLGASFTEELVKKIKTNIKVNCSPRHVPAIVIEVPDIPYTINGKKVEVAIKQIVHGQTVKNRDALANPESLEFYYDILN